MALTLGLTGTATMTVGEDETAVAHGTGDAAVLSTPRLLQLMQQATMAALEGHLPDGVITAGLRVNLDHLHGSRVGATVESSATLTRLEGRRLVFECEATSEGRTIGIGRIIRVRIDEDRFLSSL